MQMIVIRQTDCLVDDESTISVQSVVSLMQ